MGSYIVRISSEFLEISSEFVQISSELVQISSELVLRILELLIISVLRNTQKTVLHTLVSFRRAEVTGCSIFTFIKPIVKSVMRVISRKTLFLLSAKHGLRTEFCTEAHVEPPHAIHPITCLLPTYFLHYDLPSNHHQLLRTLCRIM